MSKQVPIIPHHTVTCILLGFQMKTHYSLTTQNRGLKQQSCHFLLICKPLPSVRTVRSRHTFRMRFVLQCLYQMAPCESSWNNQCCPGMKCANYVGGYCVGHPEKCICMPMNYGNSYAGVPDN